MAELSSSSTKALALQVQAVGEQQIKAQSSPGSGNISPTYYDSFDAAQASGLPVLFDGAKNQYYTIASAVLDGQSVYYPSYESAAATGLSVLFDTEKNQYYTLGGIASPTPEPTPSQPAPTEPSPTPSAPTIGGAIYYPSYDAAQQSRLPVLYDAAKNQYYTLASTTTQESSSPSAPLDLTINPVPTGETTKQALSISGAVYYPSYDDAAASGLAVLYDSGTGQYYTLGNAPSPTPEPSPVPIEPSPVSEPGSGTLGVTYYPSYDDAAASGLAVLYDSGTGQYYTLGGSTGMVIEPAPSSGQVGAGLPTTFLPSPTPTETLAFQPDYTQSNPFLGAPLSYFQQEMASFVPTVENPLPPSLTWLQAHPESTLVTPPETPVPQQLTESEYNEYQVSIPEKKFQILMDKGYIPKDSKYAGTDEKGQVLYLTPENVLRNQLVGIWNQRVGDLTLQQGQQSADYQTQIKVFEAKLKYAPKELQDAYAKGGVDGYLIAAKLYEANLTKVQQQLDSYKSTVLPTYKAGFTPEMLQALSKDTYNIQQYLIDNKNSAEALQTLKTVNFDQSVIDQAKDNAQMVLNTITHLGTLVNLPNIKIGTTIGEGGQDILSLRRAADELGLLTANSPGVTTIGSGFNQQVLLKRPDVFWNSLTKEQKQQIAQKFADDPYKSTYFASTVATWNLQASKNLGLGIIASPVTAVGTPIAKVTIPDSAIASQIKQSVNYLNQTKTLSGEESKMLNEAIKSAGLSGTWDKLSDSDKQKVATQFTRSQLGITPTRGEWVQAGLMAAAVALPFLRVAPVVGGVARVAEIPVGIGLYGTGMQSYIQNFDKLTAAEKAVYGGMLALPTALILKGAGYAVVYMGRKTVAPFLATYDMESIRMGKGMPHTELAPGIGKALGIDQTKTGIISLEKAKVDILTRDPEGNYVARPTPLERGMSLTKEPGEPNVIINTTLDTSYMYPKDATGKAIIPKTITDPIKYTVDVPRTGGALEFMGKGEYSSIEAWADRAESVATKPTGTPKMQFVATLVDKFNKTPEDVQALLDAGKTEEAGRLFVQKEINGELKSGQYLPFRTIQNKVIETEVVTPHGTDMYVVGKQSVWADKNYWTVNQEKAALLKKPEGFSDWTNEKQTKWYADRGAADKLVGKGDRIPITFVSTDPTAKPPNVLTRMTVEWATEPYTRIKRFFQMFDPNRLPKITTETGETSRLPRLSPIDAKATNQGQVHVQSPTEYYGVNVIGGQDNGTGLVVLGDRHGVYRGMRDMINNGFEKDIINKVDNWQGQQQHIVQVGDIVDRGKYYFQIRDFFNRLQDESAKTGGQVDRLLGNHELAYLTGDEIKGIDYSNPRMVQRIRQSITADVLSGKVKAASVDNGQLFTHAGVSLDKFPEFAGKDANYIANNLNSRLLDAVRTNRYSDPIFDMGQYEGGKGAGGIFWLRPGESAPEGTNLGYKQFYGHTPEMTFEGKSWAIQERTPNAIDVETATWWDRPLKDKSMLAYYDTPTMKTIPTGALLAKPGEGSYITLPFESSEGKVQLARLRDVISKNMGDSVELYPDSQVGLTLKIPEGISDVDLAKVNTKLQELLKDSDGNLSFGTVGGYPSNYAPEYIYLGLKNDKSLAYLVDLQKKVDAYAESLGYKAGDIKLQAGLSLGEIKRDVAKASESLQDIMRKQPDEIVNLKMSQFKDPEKLTVNELSESAKESLRKKAEDTRVAEEYQLLKEDSPSSIPMDYREGELGTLDNGVIAIRPEALELTRFGEYESPSGELPTSDIISEELPLESILDFAPRAPAKSPIETVAEKLPDEAAPIEISSLEVPSPDTIIPEKLTEEIPTEKPPTEKVPPERVPIEELPIEPISPEPIIPEPITPETISPEPITPDLVTPYPITAEPMPPYPVTPYPTTPYPVTPYPATPYPPQPPYPPTPPIPPEPPIPPVPPPPPIPPTPPPAWPITGEGSEVFSKRVPPGTITWRQGAKWEAVPPPYDKIYHLNHPLPGTYKFYEGKGSAYKTLQCFPKGVHVLVANPPPLSKEGLRRWKQDNSRSCHNKKIEEIVIGDKVLSYNEVTACKEFKVVTDVFCNEASELQLLRLSNGNQIICTPDHPIAVIQKGKVIWTCARQLIVGDTLVQFKYSGLNARILCLDRDAQQRRNRIVAEHRKGKTWVDLFGKETAEKMRKNMGMVHKGVPICPKGKTLEEHFGSDRALAIRSKESRSAIERAIKYPMWNKGLTAVLDSRVALNVQKRVEVIKRRCREEPAFVIQQLKNFRLYDRPNHAEKSLSYILRAVVPREYKYNGGGNLGVAIGGMIPDFWNVNGKKKVIEYFGSYWHKPEGEQQRLAKYKKFGIDCLVIWDYEMKDRDAVKKKILTFTHNPNVEMVTVVSTEGYHVKPTDVYNLEVKDNNNYFAEGVLVHNCIGGPPQQDVDLDLGWAQIHISTKGKDLEMTFGGGEEAANQRWSEEQAAMDRLAQLSYAEAPNGGYNERIPRAPRASAMDIAKYEQLNQQLEELAAENGYIVRDVPYGQLRDYAAMHPIIAKRLGYDMPENEIHMNERWNESPKDRAENLYHELEELGLMHKGEDYWSAHTDSLAGEKNIDLKRLKIPKAKKMAKEEEMNLPDRYYLGRRLRPASLGVGL